MSMASGAPGRTLARAGAIAFIALVLASGTALAGKPGGTGSVGVRVADGVFGGTTIALAGPASATHVRAQCFQGGVLVYEQYRAFDASRQATLLLGPTPAWSSGAATCRAEDGYWRRGTTWRVTSTTTFEVAAY
jgi:hypothetical protein